MRVPLTIGLLMSLLLLAAASTAAEPPFTGGGVGEQYHEGGYLPAESTGPAYLSVFDVLGKLIIVLLLAYAALHAIRWWQNHQMNSAPAGASGGRQMRLEESLSLGSDGRLHLVEVDGRRMLLAGGEDGLMQIADLTEEPVRPREYRSVRQRADGSTDELNVSASRISTRPVRPDLLDETESWETRRQRLLAELQEKE